MNDAIRLAGSTVLAAEEITEDGRQWIHVMPTASKARNGQWFFTITADDLETYADYIRANPDRVPVDYDHAGAADRSTRAAGWFTGQADVREDGLWAEVKWTPKARQEIADGEFRFISPEFTFAEKDGKTGLMTKAKELVAATLTNRPFFRQLRPVTAEALTVEQIAEVEATYGEPIANFLTAMQDAVWATGTTSNSTDDPLQSAIEQVLGAVWTTAYINDLPDSAFLYVESGEKDEDGKTTPRALRHFPFRDAEGNVDLPHLRNAIARAPQADLPDAVKNAVQERARKMLERMTAAAVAEEVTAEDSPPEEPVGEEGDQPPAEPEASEEQGEQEAGEEPAAEASDAEDEANAEGEAASANPAKGGNDMEPSIISALGVPEHADEATILAAIQAKDDEIAELKETVSGLEAKSEEAVALANRVADLEKQARKREIAIVLAEEVRTGRVAPVEVEHLARHYEANIDGLKELVNARPMHMFARMDEVGSGGEGPKSNQAHSALAKELRASDPLDADSADLHLAALKVLAERGKADSYTGEEYLSALDEASRADV